MPKSPKKPAARKPLRSVTGKRADPAMLAHAAEESVQGLKERTEAGHRAAGRTPPSVRQTARQSGAVRVVVDDSIRDAPASLALTEDAKLLRLAGRYDSPIPTWFLALLDCSKILAHHATNVKWQGGNK